MGSFSPQTLQNPWEQPLRISQDNMYRHSLGHATAYYDAKKDSIHFVSWNQLTQREDFNRRRAKARALNKLGREDLHEERNNELFARFAFHQALRLAPQFGQKTEV
jgi:hypothetical protein